MRDGEISLGLFSYLICIFIAVHPFMDHVTLTYVRIGGALVAWASISVAISMVASGRIGRSAAWTLPENRLLAGGALLILAGLGTMTFILWEFDEFIQPARRSFGSTLFNLKKSGIWDEPTIEMLRTSSERTVEVWVRFRDFLNNFVLLVSGGVGGGLCAQGLIEKHQRRLRNDEPSSAG